MIQTMIKRAKAPLSLAFAASLLFASCKKTDVQQDIKTRTSQLEQLRAFVAETTGASLSEVNYVASKDAFSISNDAFITVADARQRLQAGPDTTGHSTVEAKQRIYQYLITSSKASTITIYADATVPADWITAIDQAIANWNSTNSLIQMKRVTATTTTTSTRKGRKGGSTTTTTVPSYTTLVTTFTDNTTSTIAQSYYPDYYGNPGKEVDINTYYNTLSASNKEFAITHELGHSIGLTHTDQTYGTLVPGTPDSDPNSVMNSFVLPWAGFTNYDLVAVTTVYPK